jgi:hypothetical protein
MRQEYEEFKASLNYISETLSQKLKVACLAGRKP